MPKTCADAPAKTHGLTAHVTEDFYRRWHERASEEGKSGGELSREVHEAYLNGEMDDIRSELRKLRALITIGMLWKRPLTKEQVAQVIVDAAFLESTGGLLLPDEGDD